MLHVEKITWPDLNALDREHTVVFIPFSPLEEHGPHLPIGTDLFVACHFAESIARRIETQRPDMTALLVPPVPLGAGTIPMQGSVNIPADLVFDVARKMGAAFARDGFRYIVFTNGHMGAWHLLALENAARAVSRRYRVHAIAPSASLMRDFILRRLLAPAFNGDMAKEDQIEFFNANHGGMLETSVMMAIHPEMVKSNYTHLPRLARAAMLNWRGRQSTAWAGYMGDPARAMAIWGEITIDRVADAGAELILRVVDRGRKESARAHLFPRVPFSMAARRWGVLATAATVGASMALLATRIIGREKAIAHE